MKNKKWRKNGKLRTKKLYTRTNNLVKRKMIKIQTKVESGHEMNYSEWCSINSYQGWLKYCDSSRLSEKYIEPIQPYADRYYKDHIKKGGKKHERVRKSTQYKAA